MSATTCPPPSRLVQLVTGSLIESEADQLFAHLEHCAACQQQVDEISTRGDELITAARRPRDNSSSIPEKKLSQLIRAAQKLPHTEDTRVSSQSVTQSVSASDFVTGLRRSGLMNDDQLDQLLHDLDWNEASSESNRLAKTLVEQQKLTAFQAKLLLRGRWKGLVLGNYAILERLGQGGMGSVFKARHTRMGRMVCLKVVSSTSRQSPAVIERFRNEARALAALSHPNIVVAHDADESKGVPYLVMEYIDGDDLAKHVRAHQPLSVADTICVGVQVADALRYAHGQGVIHRDVKPHNIVATRDKQSGELSIKVLDLGLARFDSLVNDHPDASLLAAMTNTGMVIGTVDYMSPEQALDSRSADARSDIYSLGCTLVFLLTGQAPFQGETVMQRLVAHREQSPPGLQYLSGVDARLESVIHGMLAKCADDRYQTMQAVHDDLLRVARGESPEAMLTRPSTPVSQPPANRRGANQTAHLLHPTDDAPTVSMMSDGALSDLEFSVPAAPVAKPKPRRQARSKWVGINGAAAFALLAIAAATVMAAPIWKWLYPAANTIRNGGDGRALIVVSSAGFREDQFQSLTQSLTKRGVEVVATSANYGTEKTDFGSELKAPFASSNLGDVAAGQFDAVFVIGGNGDEWKPTNREVHRQFASVVETALQNNVVVVGCCEGWEAIKQTQLWNDPNYRDKHKFETHSAEELAHKVDYLFGDMLRKQ